MKILVRPETEQDFQIIHEIEVAAFGRPEEAELVKALREGKLLQEGMSLLAWWKDYPVAHVLFCPVQAESSGKKLLAVSLGPIAVLPEFQKRGIASALIKNGLGWMRLKGFEVVTVLGEKSYYERFGFSQKLGSYFDSVYAGEHFMALELKEGTIAATDKWKLIYPREFDTV